MKQAIKKFITAINIKLIDLTGKTPPRNIPYNLLNDYTMEGKVEIKEWYLNNVYFSFFPRIYTKKKIKRLLKNIEERKEISYGPTDSFLYQAMEKYSLKDKHVAIIGSATPFYESIALYFGAKKVTIIEYNKIISFHPKIEFLDYLKYDKNPVKFDVAFSISSFEHDGLGRYGDPLKPNGDLEAMEKMKSMIKPGGILFLAVPIGKDTLFWNAHRVYGRTRLPLLLKRWKVVDSFGFKKQQLNNERKKAEESYQPVFVLENS